MTFDPAALVGALPPLGAIPGDWIVQGGAVGLLGIVVLLILMGHLVPRRTVRGIEQERDLWRTVALKSLGHTEKLLPSAQITAQVTRALSDATTAERLVAASSDEPA